MAAGVEDRQSEELAGMPECYRMPSILGPLYLLPCVDSGLRDRRQTALRDTSERSAIRVGAGAAGCDGCDERSPVFGAIAMNAGHKRWGGRDSGGGGGAP